MTSALLDALAIARSRLRGHVPAALLDKDPVVFVPASEVVFGGPTEMTIIAGALRNAEDFAAEFDALLKRGYAWLNFTLEGVYEGQLVVVLETPSTVGQPGRPTSVNYSGFCQGVLANNGVLDVRVQAPQG